MLTTEQAGARLDPPVGARQVRNLIASGALKATRHGARSWLIDERDLARLQRRQRGRPPGADR